MPFRLFKFSAFFRDFAVPDAIVFIPMLLRNISNYKSFLWYYERQRLVLFNINTTNFPLIDIQ